MIVLVSYDLRGPRDYSEFYEALKAQGTWWHYLTSTWLIATTKTPEQVFSSVAPLMLNTDNILVVEIGKAYNGWLPAKAWEWIQQQQAAEAARNLTPNPYLTALGTNPLADILRDLGKPPQPPPWPQ